MEDSVYTYKVDELLSNRSEVEVRDDVPTYYKKSKRSYRKGKRSYKKQRTSYRKRSKSTRRRSSARRSRRRR
jgi:membrane-bound lytic murein transglycosylase D